MDLVIGVLDYRGVHLDFYQDPPSRQVYTIYKDNKLFFGIDNTLYCEDAKKFLDLELDQIHIFKETNSILKYFDNAGSRDIMLLQNRRILRIYLNDPSLTISDVINDALFISTIEKEKAKALS
jgi:hypothetical protein